jgi:hypothetical protein
MISWEAARSRNAGQTIAFVRRSTRGKATAMRKTILAVCCATLMGIGTAAAQTYGAPAQGTTSSSPSTSQHVMPKGKTAKGKTTKHKTVGMSKGSKTKNDMKPEDTAK